MPRIRKIRLLIADKHPSVRARIRTLAESHPDIEVVGEAASGRELLTKASALNPDVVLANVLSIPETVWQDFVHVLAQIRMDRSSDRIVFDQPHRLLVNAVRDYAIFMLDLEGRVETWNAGAERLKGYRAQEIIGQNFSCFYCPEDLATGKPARELAIASEAGKYEEEGWRVRKDGTRFWASVLISAIRDEEGVLRGFAKVVSDMTERKELLERIRALAQRAVQTGLREDLEPFNTLLKTALSVMEQPASKDRLTIAPSMKRDAALPVAKSPEKLGDTRTPQAMKPSIARGSLPSPRECQVLLLLAEGYSNREVAERIFRSVKTVETYRASIRKKLGLRNRADIVCYVQAEGRVNRRPLKATISTAGLGRPSQQTGVALEVYQAYLKGRYFLHKLRGQSIDQAVHYFQRALEFDPKDARSYAGLSTCYADAGHFKYMPCAEAFTKAKVFAEKALLLDDGLAEAHASMAMAQLFGEWDWEGSECSFRRALDLNPSFAEAHVSYCNWLAAKLRFSAAIAEAETACELDPLSLGTNLTLGWVLAFAGRLDEAQEQLAKVIEMDASYLPGAAVRGYVYALKGMYQEAFASLERLPPNHPSVGYVHTLAGNAAEARQVVAKLSHPSTGRSRPCLDLAILCLLLGDKDEGLGWLEQACEEHDNKLIYLNCYLRVHPRELGRYRREPRFVDVSKRVHLDTSAVSGVNPLCPTP